jgi:large subunit ribosomal protein L10
MAKELKAIIYREIERKLGGVDGCVLIDFRGLTAEETLDLRSSLRKSGVRMSIVQNRLTRRVFREHGAPADFEKLLRGPTAILFGEDGAVAASKAIVQWRKKNKEKAPIKGGLLQKRALSSGDVESLANIPDQATLQARVLSYFLGPLTHLVTATRGLVTHFVSAAKAHREELEKKGEAAGG